MNLVRGQLKIFVHSKLIPLASVTRVWKKIHPSYLLGTLSVLLFSLHILCRKVSRVPSRENQSQTFLGLPYVD